MRFLNPPVSRHHRPLPDIRWEDSRSVLAFPSNEVKEHVYGSSGNDAKREGQGNDEGDKASKQQRKELDAPEPAMPDAYCMEVFHDAPSIRPASVLDIARFGLCSRYRWVRSGSSPCIWPSATIPRAQDSETTLRILCNG